MRKVANSRLEPEDDDEDDEDDDDDVEEDEADEEALGAGAGCWADEEGRSRKEECITGPECVSLGADGAEVDSGDSGGGMGTDGAENERWATPVGAQWRWMRSRHARLLSPVSLSHEDANQGRRVLRTSMMASDGCNGGGGSTRPGGGGGSLMPFEAVGGIKSPALELWRCSGAGGVVDGGLMLDRAGRGGGSGAPAGSVPEMGRVVAGRTPAGSAGKGRADETNGGGGGNEPASSESRTGGVA